MDGAAAEVRGALCNTMAYMALVSCLACVRALQRSSGSATHAFRNQARFVSTRRSRPVLGCFRAGSASARARRAPWSPSGGHGAMQRSLASGALALPRPPRARVAHSTMRRRRGSCCAAGGARRGVQPAPARASGVCAVGRPRELRAGARLEGPALAQRALGVHSATVRPLRVRNASCAPALTTSAGRRCTSPSPGWPRERSLRRSTCGRRAS
jgi:hypothetical protein